MRNYLIAVLLLPNFALSGCVSSTLVVHETGPALTTNEVVVYYIDRPSCNFETVAHIRVEGGFFSLAMMVEGMRKEAANAGADGLYVMHTQRTSVREYLGTAKAIRCLPA